MEGRNMGYAGRHNIYEGAIRKMVTQALEAREEEFRKEHAADTDAQLLAYLRSCAAKLQHTPWPGEILGGTVIAQRFGSWERALTAAIRFSGLRSASESSTPFLAQISCTSCPMGKKLSPVQSSRSSRYWG